MHQNDEVFVGTFLITTDNYLLRPLGPGPFTDVDPDPNLARELDQRIDGQFVSVLGHMGERTVSGSDRVPSLIASKIVPQKDIERRAFEIFQSGEGGSALADWLTAERELLDLPKQ